MSIAIGNYPITDKDDIHECELLQFSSGQNVVKRKETMRFGAKFLSKCHFLTSLTYYSNWKFRWKPTE